MTLNVPLTTPADPSRSLRITPFIPHHYDAFRFPSLVTLSQNRHSERWQEGLVRKMRNGSVSRSEESIIRMTINVSLIMTADFARLGTFYHSPFIFRGNAIKKNRSESVPDGHKSDGIQVFQNFSKNTLEDFHILSLIHI